MSAVESKDDWVTRLRDERHREAATEQLRLLLVRGLQRSLANRYSTALAVDDVVQEALLKILDSLDQFEGRSRFTTWAMTIANRIGIAELRRKRYQDVSLDGLQIADGAPLEVAVAKEDRPDQQVERQQLLALLSQLISQELAPRQSEAIRAMLEGMPVEEVARRLNSNRNAVYKLVHDARLRLRIAFEQAGVEADDILGILK